MGDAGNWEYLHATAPVRTRESEAMLVASLVAAVAQQRAPKSDREADVYRFAAQLLQSRYQQAADFLDAAARRFYAEENVQPRSFARVLGDGLVAEPSRLRNLLERQMAGVTSW